jgi:hypothetical protein
LTFPPEVWGEESVEDRVEAGVAVSQTVGDDLEDDEAAQLDVVDAETLEEKNDLLEKFNFKHLFFCTL